MTEVDQALRLMEAIDDSSRPFELWTFTYGIGVGFCLKNVHIKEGCILRGTFGTGDTADEAILDYFHILKTVSATEVIACDNSKGRKYYRWNGAAFIETYYDNS